MLSTFTRVLPLMLVAAGIAAVSLPIAGQDVRKNDAGDDARHKEPAMRAAAQPAERLKSTRIPLSVYEWGVEAFNWDGSTRANNDMPAFYYKAADIPLEAGPVAPPQIDPVVPEGRSVKLKPVVYFDCARDLDVNIQIKFLAGEATWVFPKASRRTDTSTIQWDHVQLLSDEAGKTKDRKQMPDLRDIDAAHWANYSRDGSTGDVIVNGERERFLFYEGSNKELPEVDVFQNADGKYVVRNYTAHPVYNVRLNTREFGAMTIAKVAAANGEEFAEAIFAPAGPERRSAEWTAEGVIKTECTAAGLTPKQAAVFARCWTKTLYDAPIGTLSYLRDQQTLDEQVRIDITSDADLAITSHRVSYVLVEKVDFTKQSEQDKDARACADGDNDAIARLKSAGMGGVGALRRAMADKSLSLKQRMALATVLKSFSSR